MKRSLLFLILLCLCLTSHQKVSLKGHMETGPPFKVSSYRQVEPGIETAIPGLQDKWIINYTTAALNSYIVVSISEGSIFPDYTKQTLQ